MQTDDVTTQEKLTVYAVDFFELAEIALRGDTDEARKYLEALSGRASYAIYEDDFKLALLGFFDIIKEDEISEESLTKNGGNVIEFGPHLFKKNLIKNLGELLE